MSDKQYPTYQALKEHRQKKLDFLLKKLIEATDERGKPINFGLFTEGNTYNLLIANEIILEGDFSEMQSHLTAIIAVLPHL